MHGIPYLLGGLGVMLLLDSGAADLRLSDDEPLRLPPAGSYQLRVLSPSLLELTLVTAKKSETDRAGPWDFVDDRGQSHLPDTKEFLVSAGDKPVPVKAVGFKRRVLYAPLKQRDLRIGNWLYLQLAASISENQVVQVRNPANKLWPQSLQFIATNAPLRWSPALHVNQVGYLPAHSKTAMVGYYLGSLGELALEEAAPSAAVANLKSSLTFSLVEAQSAREVFHGSLAPRPDHGFPSPAYQHVLEADFSNFKTPGEYRLLVPGLGVSFPFFIDDGAAGAFARAYALGIYHQRCGTANELPFTRFTHGACHTAPAEVPTMTRKFEEVNEVLKKETANFKDNPRHKAPQLKSVA